jgi:plastocyanin
MKRVSQSRLQLAALCALALAPMARAQTFDVSARAEVSHPHDAAHAPHTSADVVVWLTPLRPDPAPPPLNTQKYTLAQKDKQFTPHVLVVPTGSSVDFPNLDPFFHNVFSLFNGKRFDLGLYEAGSHRAVRFDREGVSYIFCNIHPEMGAIVVSLSTAFYAVSSPEGAVLIHGVPPGSYRLNVWAENVPIDRLKALGRVVEIAARNVQLGALPLETSGDLMTHHQNKFGEGYSPVPKDPY